MLKRRSKKNLFSSLLLREKRSSKVAGVKNPRPNSTKHVKSPQRPNVKTLASGTCLSSSTLLASGTMYPSLVTMATNSNSCSSAHSSAQPENDDSSILLVLNEEAPSLSDQQPPEDTPPLSLHEDTDQKNGPIPTFVTASCASPTATTRLLSASFPDSMAIPIHGSKVASEQAKAEHSYWEALLTDRSNQYGAVHVQTARAHFSLGQSYLRSNDYTQATGAFLQAYEIYNSIHGPNHLSVAQALDSYGLTCMSFRKYEQAEKSLQRAFRIRFHKLGVWHVDTVETFNRIANVHVHMGRLDKALEEYREVFKVRRAIFGAEHPAVAITAHALANVHAKLGQTRESNTFYALAQRIYRQMGLSHDHQTVANLLSDQIKHSTPKEEAATSNFFNFFS